jgi:hypothetical protein
MRAAIGAADLDASSARVTSGSSTQSTAAISIAAEPVRATTVLRLDAIIGGLPSRWRRLARDPEKWEPVFGKDHAQEIRRPARTVRFYWSFVVSGHVMK